MWFNSIAVLDLKVAVPNPLKTKENSPKKTRGGKTPGCVCHGKNGSKTLGEFRSDKLKASLFEPWRISNFKFCNWTTQLLEPPRPLYLNHPVEECARQNGFIFPNFRGEIFTWKSKNFPTYPERNIPQTRSTNSLCFGIPESFGVKAGLESALGVCWGSLRLKLLLVSLVAVWKDCFLWDSAKSKGTPTYP